jgi:two-component sensor histidine kinase
MNRERQLLRERLPVLRDQPIAAYMLAIALSVGAGLLRGVLDPIFPPGFPYLTFFPAVTVSAFLLGRGPGTLTALLGGLFAWYFFIPPFHSLALGPATGTALLFYIGVVTVDIALVHWMQSANQRLLEERERSRTLARESSRLAERNELLFGELQHRVSNNLQMIGAVLGLQKRGITDPAARRALDDAAAKLQLIGRIQRQLYDLGGARVAVDTFLHDLVGDLIASGGKPGITFTVDCVEGALLDPDALIPLALIIAEAVANAIEHGFAGRDSGHVVVALGQTASDLTLCVTDDGAGPPEGFDLAKVGSLGLKIATTLARQLGGTLQVRAVEPHGAETLLTMKLPGPGAAAHGGQPKQITAIA